MANQIPREFIELLLARVDLVDLINAQVPLRKQSGNNYFARCPFHNEKNPSFSVSQTKQFYYCFGCGASGNAIDFLIQHDHLSFPEAVESLARQTGMEMPKSTSLSKKDDSLPALYDTIQKAAQCFYEEMRKSQRAIQYLKKRGISGSIAQQFIIGYAPPSFHFLLDQLGQSEADKKQLLDTGLIIKKAEGGYYDRFRDRIMFPIYDYRGRMVGFGGRIIDQGEPKYLNSPETAVFQKGHELYGLYQALKTNRKLDRIIIVEGYMDVIALFQHGIPYAVATLGTATTSHHFHRLFRYTTDLIFCFDGDEAGRTAAWRALQVLFPLIQDSLQVRFLFLPEGEDPDSLVRQLGKEAFEKLINEAPSLSTFFLQTLSKQSDMGTMEGRARFAAQALPHIKQIPGSLFQGLLLEELSKRTRIDVQELRQQIKSPEAAKPIASSAPAQDAKTKLPAPVKAALAMLLQHPHLAALIKEPLPEPCALPGYALFSELVRIIQNKPEITTGALIEYWRGQKEESFIAKLAQWQPMVPVKGIEKEFAGALRQLSALQLEEEINRLLSKASLDGLTQAEKLELTNCINKKKQLGEMIT